MMGACGRSRQRAWSRNSRGDHEAENSKKKGCQRAVCGLSRTNKQATVSTPQYTILAPALQLVQFQCYAGSWCMPPPLPASKLGEFTATMYLGTYSGMWGASVPKGNDKHTNVRRGHTGRSTSPRLPYQRGSVLNAGALLCTEVPLHGARFITINAQFAQRSFLYKIMFDRRLKFL